LLQLKKLLHQRHLPLSSGFSLELPSNYIVWRGAITKEKQQKKFIAATNKLERIAPIILEKKVLPPEKGPFWQNPLFSWVYRKSYPRIGQMDKSFFADEKCNACGICANVCPAQNIVLSGGKPAWLHRCEQCFACIQWCPEEAIQAGRNTRNKVRYHHPDISLKDMLAFASQKENRRPI
jgi:Pyruvate/2-oxoacid:ferredoxin oxidoreductase delta subunit